MGTTRGFGGTIRSAAGTPPAAAPAVTGMRNGLSLVGGFGELGADPFAAPAPLLHNTVIDLATFFFALQEGGADFLGINATADTFNIGNEVIGSGLSINSGEITGSIGTDLTMRLSRLLSQYVIGDVSGTDNGSLLLIDDNLLITELIVGPGVALRLDRSNGFYSMGDVSGSVNATTLEVDDAQSRVQAIVGANPAGLNLDGAIGRSGIGDVFGFANSTSLQVEDSLQQIRMQSVTGIMLDFDISNSTFIFGATNFGNQTFTSMDDTAGTVEHFAMTGRMLSLQQGFGLFSMGDLDLLANGGSISIDDGGNVVDITNTAANMGLRINGVAGISGTFPGVTSITVNNGIVTAAA